MPIVKDLSKPEYDELRDRYSSWRSVRDAHLEYSRLCEEYFNQDVEGTRTLFTQMQLKKLRDKTNIEANFNIIYPIIEQRTALLMQNKPSFKIVSFDGRAKEIAHILDKAKHSLLYSSDGFLENKSAIKNAQISGIGHLMMDEASFYQPGEFGITYRAVPEEEVILDPNSKYESNIDMEGFFTEKEITITKCYEEYTAIANDMWTEEGRKITLEDMASNTGVFSYASTATANTTPTIISKPHKTIWLRNYYDKRFATMLLIKNPETGGYEKVIMENIEDKEMQQMAFEMAEQREPNIYVRKRLMFGQWIVEEKFLTLLDYPLQSLYFNWSNRPYKSYGLVHYIKGLQEINDKTLQIFLMNGILNNNPNVEAAKGNITSSDRDNWEIYGNDPTRIKEFVPIVIEGQVFKPEKTMPTPLNPAYSQILEFTRYSMEYTTGVNAMIQGNAEAAKVDVFSSLQQYQNAAMQRVIFTSQHVNAFFERVGNVAIQYLIAKMAPDTYYLFYDDETKQPQESQVGQAIVNELKLGKWKVVAIPGELAPTQKIAMATEMFKISQTTPDPMERQQYIKKAFELSDMRGFDEMQEELNTIRQLQQQIQGMQQQLERDQELMKQYENRALNAEYQAKLMAKLAGIQAQLEGEKEKVKGELENEKLQEQLKEAKKPAKE